ncbi:MAG: hypothetical protein HQK63_14880 [Desulfamplus sp.]|nr:hypothetical protein [Desulfamplus sp.]
MREGWDNPNIFTLCTLKSSISDIAKKQESGRGLRLPVDVTGKRIRDNKINELTVIANEHYDVFAETLQKDFNDSMAFNRDEVTAEILTESLKKAGLPEEKITPELVDSFKRELQANNIINNKNVLSKDAVKIGAIEFKDETLKEHAAKIKESFTNFMHQKGSHKIPIINKDEQAVENREWNYVSEESFKKILDNLRNKLMKRSIYRFNLEQGKFIDECVAEINEDLKYKSDTLTYEIAQGSQSVDETRKFDFKMSSVIQRDEKKSLASQAVERSYR